MHALLFVLFSGIGLATLGLFTQLMDRTLHPTTILFFRLSIGSLVIAFYLSIFHSDYLKITLKEFKTILPLTLTTLSAMLTAIWAFSLAPMQQILAILSISPFVIIILSRIFLNEELTSLKIISLLIASIGMLIINPLTTLGSSFILVLCSINVLAAAGMEILAKKNEVTVEPLKLVFWTLLIGSVILSPSLLLIEESKNVMTNLYYLLGIGIISTGIAFSLHYISLKYLEAGIVSILTFILIPTFGFFFSMYFLGDVLNTSMAIGIFLLILGGMILELGPKINEFVRRFMTKETLPVEEE